MLMGSLSPGMILLILVVALLIFGPSKLPELGRSFGKTLREFKNGANEIMNDHDAEQPPRKEVGPEAADAEKSQRDQDSSKRLPD